MITQHPPPEPALTRFCINHHHQQPLTSSPHSRAVLPLQHTIGRIFDPPPIPSSALISAVTVCAPRSSFHLNFIPLFPLFLSCSTSAVLRFQQSTCGGLDCQRPTMCNCFADGDIEVQERPPRYVGEPRRARLSFVRDKDSKSSDESSIYRSSATVRRDDFRRRDDHRPRDDFRPFQEARNDYNVQYRSPTQPEFRGGQDFRPLPPPIPPPPMIHYGGEPYRDQNLHGIEVMNGGADHRSSHRSSYHDDIRVIEEPDGAMIRMPSSRRGSRVVVHSSRRGGRDRKYYDDSDDDSWTGQSPRSPRSVFSEDSWTESYRHGRSSDRRRSRSRGSRYHR